MTEGPRLRAENRLPNGSVWLAGVRSRQPFSERYRKRTVRETLLWGAVSEIPRTADPGLLIVIDPSCRQFGTRFLKHRGLPQIPVARDTSR